MGSPYDLVSRDAQELLQEFSDDFALALVEANVEEWAKQNGLYRSTKALKTTFPIPISAAGYHEFKGEIKYRALLEKSLEMKPKTWQDGYAELARVVEAPDFIGWNAEPAAMAVEAKRLTNEIIAAALEANAVHPYDDVAFFSGSHPYNVFKLSLGTFDNDHAGAPTIANLKTAKANFRAIKKANGKPLGLRMTHVLIAAAQEEEWKDLLELDMILQSNEDDSAITTLPNRHKGTVKMIVSDELTNDDKWYPLALNKPGMYPWVVQDQGAPEEILSDKTSHLYKTTLKIGAAYILEANGALALPHCIQRWDGVDP